MSGKLKIGIIGGTGLDDPDILDKREEIVVETAYGSPSDSLICGTIEGVDCVLLSRHGRKHDIMPTNLNFRANICALKQQGCTHLIVTTACGSLKEEIEPGHFVILDQFIDRTTKRETTFYDGKPGSWGKVCHIPMSQPFNPTLRKILEESCKLSGGTCHPTGTMVTVEGPRFSTFAESQLYRSWNASVINMTTVPEAALANEAGIPYAAVAMATDYDCWKQDERTVNAKIVMENFKKNAETAKQVLRTAVGLIAKEDWTKDIQEAKEKASDAVMAY